MIWKLNVFHKKCLFIFDTEMLCKNIDTCICLFSFIYIDIEP